jgi:transcriptional regulator with XRE-family HTH domain
MSMIYCRPMTTQVEKFWNWVEEEREKRGMSYRAIEETGGVSNGTVSGRARQLLPPTANTFRAVSRAFNLPFDVVAKQASAQPSMSSEAISREEALHLFDQLSPTQRKIILAQMRVLADMEPEEEEAGQRLLG